MIFFFNDTATTEIYTLSLHDALPIFGRCPSAVRSGCSSSRPGLRDRPQGCRRDRKSTRLNSSHSQISYAVFCLKKKSRDPKRTAILRLGRDGGDPAPTEPGDAGLHPP